MSFSPQLSVEPTVSVNWVDLLEGAFTTTLVGSRVTYTMTPRMFVSALLQYNSGNNVVASNVRLRWEYQPGSELFVVFNEQRDTLGASFSGARQPLSHRQDQPPVPVLRAGLHRSEDRPLPRNLDVANRRVGDGL